MNIVEKIIARHAFVKAGQIGVDSVKPGDALFAVADVRFSHEYVTPMAESLFKQALGIDARVTEPQSVFAFRDHLTFLNKVMSTKHREMGLLERADGLATTQESFTKSQGIKLYGENPEGGSEAICITRSLKISLCQIIAGKLQDLADAFARLHLYQWRV